MINPYKSSIILNSQVWFRFNLKQTNSQICKRNYLSFPLLTVIHTHPIQFSTPYQKTLTIPDLKVPKSIKPHQKDPFTYKSTDKIYETTFIPQMFVQKKTIANKFNQLKFEISPELVKIKNKRKIEAQ
ncbi:Hypothetical_protein [Hexamita inflata]|uniref:Hypothetical_protein n=1 Tax=Hexamita inflata TaxID=28002 RepID=A0AA86P3A3_9EUKA|nr:Hypothetical protein HINF_LOCUS18095 [Hexamita inflata]